MKVLIDEHGLSHAWVGAKRKSGATFEWIVSLAELPGNSALWDDGYPDGLGDCVYQYGFDTMKLINADCISGGHYICERY